MAAGGEQSQDKTEQPTSKKLSDAREKGNVPSSREVPSVLILLGGITVLFFGGSWMFGQLGLIMRSMYQQAGTMVLTVENLNLLFWDVSIQSLKVLLPLMLVVVTAGAAGSVLQFGFLMTTGKMTPDLSKLNPVNGLKRMVSLRSFVELIKSLIKLAIVGTVAYIIIRRYVDEIPGLMQLFPGGILAFIGKAAFQISIYAALALFLMAALDFGYTRWQHTQDLKMTKQEVRDEYKQREGDPAVKARIRSIQRELARHRMMEAVPGATVVITNPTHLAIAIRYEEGMHAPTVVAKGAGLIAEKIKEIAEAHSIPHVENKPLAQTLFKSTEIGDFIPVDLYKAVAEVLAYVYRLKGLVRQVE
ncbi:flagellar biosynthesis protein FlhB [Desulfosarcina sp. OttesenSCG-928-G10]|nr:flagellar biosynthesis protein FlhB [Desulfosarcina sp. OttesenSCG-928-G10]MDL2321747.1 flagellar biosynthesis protein FlhB [Desulfosarcina sp. OttesenSCG-928-B08]